jgi:dTDP-4-dehydrorhamnose reductase
MTRIALRGSGQVKVVADQIGQPTSAKDLAKQIIKLVLGKASYGIYHGTNTGSASWFDFAREIFVLAGADASRLVPVSTSEFPRPAKRPEYSVLSHESWKKTDIEEMRAWEKALAEEMPKILMKLKRGE